MDRARESAERPSEGGSAGDDMTHDAATDAGIAKLMNPNVTIRQALAMVALDQGVMTLVPT